MRAVVFRGERPPVVMTNALEDARIARVAPDLECLLVDALGQDELITAGHGWAEIEYELCVRAAAVLGITEAAVPPEFPLALADRLRGVGIVLTPDETLFVERRRRKTPAEMAGIRRAADVAVSAMREAAAMLREAAIDADYLSLAGERLDRATARTRTRRP
jgi:Xaa-Pro aminopeptidase